jgi:hypothetical protein
LAGLVYLLLSRTCLYAGHYPLSQVLAPYRWEVLLYRLDDVVAFEMPRAEVITSVGQFLTSMKNLWFQFARK